MNWFENLRTGKKLYISFGITLILQLMIGLAAFITIYELDKVNKTISKEYLGYLETSMQLRDNISDNESNIFLLFLNKNESSAIINNLERDFIERNELFYNLKSYTEKHPEEKVKIDEIKKISDKTVETYKEKFLTNVQKNNINTVPIYTINALNSQFNEMGNLSLDLVKDIRKQINESIIYADKVKIFAFIFCLGLLAFSILTIIFIVRILNHQIANPLVEITKAAEEISLGDISNKKISGTGRKDEVGILADTFLKLTNWLNIISSNANQISKGDLTADIKLQSDKDVLGLSFKTMIENLGKLTNEIKSSINSLETSSNQISAASMQLTSSSSETATAISETTTTIEEVKQTSHLTTQKAKQISESAKKSNETAQGGKDAAEQFNLTINNIQNQMNLIAESMLRLSEQTQTIGTIITSVEDMAQQSNLLAVNASIEAAKAGEQGKGFAIVAQEVKTLANQSKQATNQVRDILNDIQKATSAAVMATEQGSKAVSEAVKKSDENAQSILRLVNTVASSSNEASQITATANQQLIGMEQAAVAMENIKEATHQNVEGSKELEVAAKAIKNLGTSLKDLISRYKLKQDNN